MVSNEGLVKIFEYALNQEQTGKSFFQTSIQRMGIGAAVSAFERLIEEENKHIAFIETILSDLKKGENIRVKEVEKVVLEPTDYFGQRAQSEFLAECVEGSMVPDVTVFNTAWLIEKDLSEFYDRMGEKAEGAAKDALKMLAMWERGHEKFFRKYRDKLSEVYGNMPWGG
jgi:rubrerythrin